MKSVSLTNRQLSASMDAIGVISKLREGIPPENLNKLVRYLRKIDDALNDFNKANQLLLLEHWREGKDGVRAEEFSPKDPAAWHVASYAFYATQIEIGIPAVELGFFGPSAKLNAGQRMALDWWVKTPEDSDETASE